MKNLKKLSALIVAASLAAGSSNVFAASPGEGLRGADGGILSQVTTYAGSGEFAEANGAALSASFRAPERIAVAKDGTVYVSDTVNHIIRKVKDGQVTTYAGITLTRDEAGLPEGTLVDGKAEASLFQKPAGLALDAHGNLYVADSGNHAIRKISVDGTVTTVAGNGVLGTVDGKGAEARFFGPQDVAVAADGTIYVADSLNHLIRKIDADGTVSTLNAASTRAVEVVPGAVEAAGDYKDGALDQAKFNEPSSIELDAKGNLYVSDSGNGLIRYIDVAANTVTTVAGTVRNPMYEKGKLYSADGYKDGSALTAEFHFPKGIALTKEGGLVIADTLNHAVRYLHNGTVTTLAGSTSGDFGKTNGIEGNNLLHAPSDVAVLSNDDILIGDSYNNAVRLYALYRQPDGLKNDGTIHVTFNGALLQFDTQPEIADNRTMVPLSVVGKSFGYEVSFDKGVIRMKKNGTTLELVPGKTEIRTQVGDGEAEVRAIDAAPYIKGERTYVPIRFFSEEFGLDVEWDKSTRTVILREKTL
ncbi:stalk domain-containing protein [Paenibacillus alkalitolerans]|uniref:stalk domain-containing protein n=1 Tax=Paenibacillus alkalitolerans TaxID=2799335 RepID=UPI0018F799F6|nr:stalk domain-containing protein [Paenibacillus alkalitolerans]